MVSAVIGLVAASACKGEKGSDGADGPMGIMGSVGDPGGSGLHCWDIDGDGERDEAEDVNNDGDWTTLDCQASGRGVVFTRWGYGTCPPLTTELYSGVAAGSWYLDGGGANTLCLHAEPTWLEYDDADNGLGSSKIFGVEYQTANQGIGSLLPLNDEDAPCAVCIDEEAALHLMIPGTEQCPVGWTEQYDGYLMSSLTDQRRSDFVCVDRAPQARPGGSADQDGSVWFTIEAGCGSLPCGGDSYVQNREITCVVCTR